jgi:hypothetical protein
MGVKAIVNPKKLLKDNYLLKSITFVKMVLFGFIYCIYYMMSNLFILIIKNKILKLRKICKV